MWSGWRNKINQQEKKCVYVCGKWCSRNIKSPVMKNHRGKGMQGEVSCPLKKKKSNKTHKKVSFHLQGVIIIFQESG